MTSAGRLGRIEEKLGHLVAESCRVCQQRVAQCPQCGRSVGVTQAEREAGLVAFHAELDRLRIALEKRSDE